MNDGSIKLCKDIKQLFDSGWKDPDYVQKVTVGFMCFSMADVIKLHQHNLP